MSRATITPHASHVWGRTEGERYCRVCHAQPWMAMSERPCGEESRQDHSERDAAVLAAHAAGEPLKAIARDVGICRETVGRIIARHGTAEERRARSHGPPITLEHAIEAHELHLGGKTWREIGTLLGRPRASIKAAVGDMRRGIGPLAQGYITWTEQRRAS